MHPLRVVSITEWCCKSGDLLLAADFLLTCLSGCRSLPATVGQADEDQVSFDYQREESS